MGLLGVIQPGKGMPHIYLCQPELQDHGGRMVWAAPRAFGQGRVTFMDFRGPDPGGFGLAVYETEQAAHPLLHAHLGSDPEAILSSANLRALRDRLPTFDGSANRVTSIVRDLLYNRGDVTGAMAHRPFYGSRRRGARIHLGAFGKIVDEPFDTGHQTFPNAVADFRDAYRRHYGILDARTLRRFTGHRMLALYGSLDEKHADELMPPEHREDGFERPQTTVGDTFVEASDTNLESHTATGPNGGFSWGEVTASMIVIASSDVVQVDAKALVEYRAESDLSSDDQLGSLDIITLTGAGSDNQWLGPSVRWSASNAERYGSFVYQDNDNIYLAKYDSGGSETLLDNTAVTLTLPNACTCEVSGSGDLEATFNGTTLTHTDASPHTGNLRSGIHSFRTGSGTPVVEGDNFEVSDVGAGGPTTAPWYYRAQQAVAA